MKQLDIIAERLIEGNHGTSKWEGNQVNFTAPWSHFVCCLWATHTVVHQFLELRVHVQVSYSSNFNVDSRTCACSINNEHFSCVVRETVHITTNKPARQLNIQKHTHRGKWDAISNCIWMSILGCVGICGRWLGQINTVKYYQQSLGTHNKVTYIHTLALAVNKAKGKVKEWKAFRKQNIQLN